MMLVIQNQAKEDIKEIYSYSFSNFGERQADKYYSELSERMESIANGFVSSSDCSHIRKNLKRTNFESHAIYYRIEGGVVTVIRVLGQNQDTLRHINYHQ